MDHFGIGSALLGAARIYFQSARQSGRTTSLLQSVKNGDRVIVRSQSEQKMLERMFSERKLNVQVRVLPPDKIFNIHEQLGTSQGKTIFDHTWLEEYYLNCLKSEISDIDELQKSLSGWGEAHEKTRMQAEQMSRWGF